MESSDATSIGRLLGWKMFYLHSVVVPGLDCLPVVFFFFFIKNEFGIILLLELECAKDFESEVLILGPT